MTIVYTVCNRHQVSNAISLGKSLKKHHPDLNLVLGWVDSAPLPGLPHGIESVPVESLTIPQWERMQHNYLDFELIAACVPFFCQHILKQYPECTELLYLTPTTYLYNQWSTVVHADTFVQLTPHRQQPIPSPRGLDDKRILNIGMYHSGGWILHPNGQEASLLDWWCERVQDRAYFDLCQGMCMNQLWLNYVPIYFDQTALITHAGWQYGLHALPGSQLTKAEGQYFVNGNVLISVDFAGIESYHPVWSDHKSLVTSSPLWKQLRKTYRKEIDEVSYAMPAKGTPYGRPAEIKSLRNQRKKIVGLLKTLIHKIEKYNLTYN
jgi:hypothetical protein